MTRQQWGNNNKSNSMSPLAFKESLAATEPRAQAGLNAKQEWENRLPATTRPQSSNKMFPL